MKEKSNDSSSKKFALVLEISDIEVSGFPTAFPMIYLADEKTLDKYNSLLFHAMEQGFDPKTRRMCFTSNCSEGISHGDMYEMIKELPEVSQEIYDILTLIPAWNPVEAGISTLEKYIEMMKAVDDSKEIEEKREQMGEIIAEHLRTIQPRIYEEESED